MIFEKISEVFAILGLMVFGYAFGKLIEYFKNKKKKSDKNENKNN